jgi:hypothetical protein
MVLHGIHGDKKHTPMVNQTTDMLHMSARFQAGN